MLAQTKELFNFDHEQCNTLTELISHADQVLETSAQRAEAIMASC